MQVGILIDRFWGKNLLRISNTRKNNLNWIEFVDKISSSIFEKIKASKTRISLTITFFSEQWTNKYHFKNNLTLSFFAVLYLLHGHSFRKHFQSRNRSFGSIISSLSYFVCRFWVGGITESVILEKIIWILRKSIMVFVRILYILDDKYLV